MGKFKELDIELPAVAKIPETTLKKMNTKRLLSTYRGIKKHMYGCICDCGCGEVREEYQAYHKALAFESRIVKAILDKRENVEK